MPRQERCLGETCGLEEHGVVRCSAMHHATHHAVHDTMLCEKHRVCCAVLCGVQPTQRTLASPPGALGASFHTRRKPRLGCEICLLWLFGLFSGLTWLGLEVGLLIVVVWSWLG